MGFTFMKALDMLGLTKFLHKFVSTILFENIMNSDWDAKCCLAQWKHMIDKLSIHWYNVTMWIRIICLNKKLITPPVQQECKSFDTYKEKTLDQLGLCKYNDNNHNCILSVRKKNLLVLFNIAFWRYNK